jgi:hypothetical protein
LNPKYGVAWFAAFDIASRKNVFPAIKIAALQTL